jgi:hypothetical protein
VRGFVICARTLNRTEADLSSTSVMKKKTETSLSVFLSFSLNFQKDAILNPCNTLDTCNANPIQEKKKFLQPNNQLFPVSRNYYILCGEALKTNKSMEPSRNMDLAFFFMTTLRLIAQKSISTTKQFKSKQPL